MRARAWTLITLVLLGCGQAPAPETVDVDAAYKRVVNPVPPPPDESALGSAVESYLDQAAADAESPRTEVELLTATWCGPCKNAHRIIVPWLQAKGYTVKDVDVSDCDDPEKLKAKHGVEKIPTFRFKRGSESEDVTGPRYQSSPTGFQPFEPDFKSALATFPPPPKDAVAFGLSVPAISVADLTEGIAGMDQDLFGVVHVTVPKDVSWTVTKKAASVLLTFKDGKQPSLRSLKYVRANPSLLSVEISPFYAEFKTDSWWPMLKTVRVEFDYSPPVAKSVKTASPARGRYFYRPQQPQYRYVPQKAPPVAKVVEAPAPEPEPTLAPLAINPEQPVVPELRQAWLASVAITTLKPRQSIFGYEVPAAVEGYGSGFVFRSDGYVLTNQHVVEGCTSYKVTFCNGQERSSKLVGTDDAADIAVLKVDETELSAMPIASSPSLVAGTEVYALGNPFGFNSSLTRGIISNISRSIEYADGSKRTGLLQSDTAINPGNSGGAMLNRDGEAVGVCVAMHSGGYRLGLAIPIQQAMEAANKLVKP